MNYLTGVLSWVYSPGESNNNNDGDNVTNSDDEGSDAVITKPINYVIPLFTKHQGVVYMYYKTRSVSIYNLIKRLEPMNIVTEEETRTIDGLFKWAFGRNKIDKSIEMMNSFVETGDMLKAIEKLRKDNSDLELGNPEEFKNNIGLNPDIIQRFTSDRPLIRILYAFNWSFSLDISKNWEDAVVVNENDLIAVTKKPERRKLYHDYIQKYKNCVKSAIEFRKRHYHFLIRDEPIINVNAEFIEELIALFGLIFDYMMAYNDFTTSLNWFEMKRFDEYNNKLNGYPSFNITFKWKRRKILRTK